jgi:peptidoglycan hydrolase-like protein with peptidoglycan-binding domain
MEITESELSAQYQRAKSQWPFIHQTELARGLPRMLLFAVGSRETNLTNEVGDNGHGHGVWQLDNRSHTPPGGFAAFDGNVPLQCSIAADMLHDLLAMEAGNVQRAANRYNSGHPETERTTHQNYGPDVVQRMQTLQRLFPSAGPSVSGNAPAWFTRDLGIASPFMHGSDVGVVQRKTGADPDGQFGPITREHVVNFQSHHGLTADGIVGPITARVLGP